MPIYPPSQQTKVLTPQQKRIKEWYARPQLLESLLDRSKPIPLNDAQVEQLLHDLETVYLGMHDARYPLG